MTGVSRWCEEISKVVLENEGPETIVRIFGLWERDRYNKPCSLVN
jgi:hypothetical protein